MHAVPSHIRCVIKIDGQLIKSPPAHTSDPDTARASPTSGLGGFRIECRERSSQMRLQSLPKENLQGKQCAQARFIYTPFPTPRRLITTRSKIHLGSPPYRSQSTSHRRGTAAAAALRLSCGNRSSCSQSHSKRPTKTRPNQGSAYLGAVS